MISRCGTFYPSLVKEFYYNIIQKNNKDLATIRTTVKGIPISIDQVLLSCIASIPNEGLTITFFSPSRIMLEDDVWKHSDAYHRIRI